MQHELRMLLETVLQLIKLYSEANIVVRILVFNIFLYHVPARS
jgi:hypothetical protein